METQLPAGIEIVDLDTLAGPAPSEDLIEGLRAALIELGHQANKALYRDEQEIHRLASTDVSLFSAALRLCGGPQDIAGRVLSSSCYIVTNSARYMRAARENDLRDTLTARPQQLTSVLELIAGPALSDQEYTTLFENPFLIAAVDEVWNDVQVLIDHGVSIADKSLVKLRYDLDDALHERIAALETTVTESGDDVGESVEGALESETARLLKEVRARGYSFGAEEEQLRAVLREKESEIDELRTRLERQDEILEGVEARISEFGRRKRKYLRRMARLRSGGS